MDWDFFLQLDDTKIDPPGLRLSERDRALIVSVLSFVESRSEWQAVDDVTWDEIEAYLGDLSNEIAE